MLYAPGAELIPFPSITAVATAVAAGMADAGVVPIENSLEGSVNETLDMLIDETQVRISQELVLPIRQCLLVKPGTQADEVRVIYSHPQALAQCRNYLAYFFPNAQVAATASTAAAVEQMMKDDQPAAAIGPQRAAQLWGAQTLAQNIQGPRPNITRFVVLTLRDHPPTGDDKTSLCFSFAEDKPGLLYQVIGEFAQRRINLAKIESRPMKDSLGSYYFLIDCQGHRQDKVVAEALAAVKAHATRFKVFGSYPRYQEGS